MILVVRAESYIKAAVVLHNFLRQTENAAYTPSGFIDCETIDGSIKPGFWRNEIGQNLESKRHQ